MLKTKPIARVSFGESIDQEDRILMKRLIAKTDMLLHKLDRMEDTLDDIHDHLIFIMDEMYGAQFEEMMEEEKPSVVGQAVVANKKLKKSDDQETVYDA